MRTIFHSAAGRNTINWASGTSTEIFIFPADGSFAERDFTFRISTATVEAEESVFTFFEGVTRHLMILQGNLELIHEGRYTKHLAPFDLDTFSGEWSTRSKGRVTDFNLMLKGGAKGSLKHRVLQAGAPVAFVRDADFHFLYVATGELTPSDGTTAKAGDLVQLPDEGELQLSGVGDVVEIRVKLP